MNDGFTYIEILVSLTLLAIVIMMINQWQKFQVQQMKILYCVREASHLIHNALEMKLAKQLTQTNIDEWRHEVCELLPGGSGHIEKQRIIILWGGKIQCTESVLAAEGCLSTEL